MVEEVKKLEKSLLDMELELKNLLYHLQETEKKVKDALEELDRLKAQG
jgi:hypothetical protein